MLKLIGNTPVVRIGKIFAKLEKFNPSGSVKDRAVSYMILSAIREGNLTKDKIILDATSGNTGISIAMISAVLGYRAVLVMPDSMSEERRKIIKAYGAEIMLVSGGMDDAIGKAIELANDKKYFYLDQFSNELNVQAHYETTGSEILRQVNDVTHVVAGMGSGGTLMGISKFFKERKLSVRIVGVEPIGSIQGLKNMSTNNKPKIFDFSAIDEKVVVTSEQANEAVKDLARMGIFVGQSSGAAFFAAKQIAGKAVVVIFPDGGEKYLSTEMFNYS
jgi:cysteine synthase